MCNSFGGILEAAVRGCIRLRALTATKKMLDEPNKVVKSGKNKNN